MANPAGRARTPRLNHAFGRQTMIEDFFRLNRLDRFTQIGRFCQLLGFACVVGPIGNIAIRSTMHEPNVLLDSLPASNPLGFAYRHPFWVLPLNVLLGLWLLFIGTEFLPKRPWAPAALRYTCWIGVIVCIAAALLFGASSIGPGNPPLRIFDVGCAAMAVVWAVILIRVAREFKTAAEHAH